MRARGKCGHWVRVRAGALLAWCGRCAAVVGVWSALTDPENVDLRVVKEDER